MAKNTIKQETTPSTETNAKLHDLIAKTIKSELRPTLSQTTFETNQHEETQDLYDTNGISWLAIDGNTVSIHYHYDCPKVDLLMWTIYRLMGKVPSPGKSLQSVWDTLNDGKLKERGDKLIKSASELEQYNALIAAQNEAIIADRLTKVNQYRVDTGLTCPDNELVIYWQSGLTITEWENRQYVVSDKPITTADYPAITFGEPTIETLSMGRVYYTYPVSIEA